MIAIVDQFDQLITDGTIDPTDLDQILGMAIRRIKKELGNDKIEDWFDGVLALAGDAGPTSAFLKKVLAGLESAFGVDAAKFSALVDSGRAKMKEDGLSGQQAAFAVSPETEESLGLAGILAIIELIFKIIEIVKGVGFIDHFENIESLNRWVWLCRDCDVVVGEAVLS